MLREAEEVGCDGVIERPLDRDLLARRLMLLIRRYRKAGREANYVTSGRFVEDANARRKRAGREHVEVWQQEQQNAALTDNDRL